MVRGLIRSSGASMLAAICSGSGSATAPDPPRQVPPEASTCRSLRVADRDQLRRVRLLRVQDVLGEPVDRDRLNPCAHDATRWVATTTDSA